MTSDSLRELKSLIKMAYDEKEQISRDFSQAQQENVSATRRFNSWNTGFLLKRIFKKSFDIRRVEAEIAMAKISELEEQLRLTTISTQVQLENGQAESFFKMRDDFTILSECEAIWDVKSYRATDKFRERTVANMRVSRERIKYTLGKCDLIHWEQDVPHLQNANGGDIFLYPGFILYRASKTAFSVIDCHDVNLTFADVGFHEQEGVPGDSTIVGQTWAKANKDGSRDRRFVGNYQIPVVRYGELTLRSETGLWEEYLFSNPKQLEKFVQSWNAFVSTFDRRISLQFDEQAAIQPTTDLEKLAKHPKLVGADIQFECNFCDQPIEVNAEAVGQEFRCPSCGERLVVPQPSV